MKKLLLITFGLFASVSLHAQVNAYLGRFSSIYVDFATGLITGYAGTQVYDFNPSEVPAYETGYAQITLSSGGFDFEQDNCGVGCGAAVANGTTTQLGVSESEFSSHFGQLVDLDLGSWQDFEQTSASQYLPSSSISLMQINATDPRNVVWSYNTFGGPLFTKVFTLGPIVVFNSSGNTFTVDQVAYPPDYSSGSVTGYAYGIPVYSAGCTVHRADGVAVKGPSVHWPLIDGNGLPLEIIHDTTETTTPIDYCQAPAGGAAALTVADTFSSGSITSNKQLTQVQDMSAIEEDHRLSSSVDFGDLGLPAPGMPPQSGTFQSRETNNGWNLWFPRMQQTLICIVHVVFGTANGGDLYVVPTSLLPGCNSHTLQNY